MLFFAATALLPGCDNTSFKSRYEQIPAENADMRFQALEDCRTAETEAVQIYCLEQLMALPGHPKEKGLLLVERLSSPSQQVAETAKRYALQVIRQQSAETGFSPAIRHQFSELLANYPAYKQKIVLKPAITAWIGASVLEREAFSAEYLKAQDVLRAKLYKLQ